MREVKMMKELGAKAGRGRASADASSGGERMCWRLSRAGFDPRSVLLLLLG